MPIAICALSTCDNPVKQEADRSAADSIASLITFVAGVDKRPGWYTVRGKA